MDQATINTRKPWRTSGSYNTQTREKMRREFFICSFIRGILFIVMFVWFFIWADKDTMVGKWMGAAVFNDFNIYLSIFFYLLWMLHFRYARSSNDYNRVSSSQDPEQQQQPRVRIIVCRNALVRLIQNNSKFLAILSAAGTVVLYMAGVGICLYEQKKPGVELTFALLGLFSTVVFMLLYAGF